MDALQGLMPSQDSKACSTSLKVFSFTCSNTIWKVILSPRSLLIEGKWWAVSYEVKMEFVTGWIHWFKNNHSHSRREHIIAGNKCQSKTKTHKGKKIKSYSSMSSMWDIQYHAMTSVGLWPARHVPVVLLVVVLHDLSLRFTSMAFLLLPSSEIPYVRHLYQSSPPP